MRSYETFGVIGSGDFGRVVAEHLSPEGSEVLVFDINKDAELTKNSIRADFGRVATSNIVVIAVPFDSYQSVVTDLAELSSPEALIVDVCSVKIKPTEMFETHGLLDRENVLMTHPLFGPQTITKEGIDGKNVVITRQNGDRANSLVDVWLNKGLNRINMSAEEHDSKMAKVHVLPFFIGRSLLNMGIDKSPIGTDYYSKLLELVDVERLHSPELFDTIQRHNPFAAAVRAELITNLCELHIQIGSGDSESKDIIERRAMYRDNLDMIDDLWTILLRLRFNVTDNIGIMKAENNIPSRDIEREKLQRLRIKKLAQDRGMPVELVSLVSSIQSLIVDEVVKRHETQKQRQITAS